MRNYSGFRLDSAYLEEDVDEEEEEDGIANGKDRGLAALSAEKARRSVLQQRRVDDEQEVGCYIEYIYTCKCSTFHYLISSFASFWVDKC